MTRFDRLIRIADRLGKVLEGSPAADQAIHDALARAGAPPPYTHDEAAALALLPTGFEVLPPLIGRSIYAAVRRTGLYHGFPYGHHGQWGATGALALAGAILRARAALAMRSEAGEGA
jgi:hypothetical protein